jgi:hypothetical protein
VRWDEGRDKRLPLLEEVAAMTIAADGREELAQVLNLCRFYARYHEPTEAGDQDSDLARVPTPRGALRRAVLLLEELDWTRHELAWLERKVRELR